MRSVLKWMLIGGAGTVLVLGISACATISSLGTFTRINKTYAGTCERISGMPGAEDIEADYQTGIAYVSSDDRWAQLAGKPEPGTIYSLDMNRNGTPVPVAMTGTETLLPFHPHGISLFKESDRTLLFVISHNSPEAPAEGHKVYIFQVEGTHLNLLEAIEDVGIRSPNDLAAVGPRQFYFTNDRKALSGGAQTREVLFGLKRGDISYFDGTQAKTVADRLAFANGIRVNSDGSKLYATAFRSGDLYVYDRDSSTGNLSLSKTVNVGNGPDNVSLGDDGHLWIANHPNALATTAHAGNPDKLSPVRLHTVEPDDYTVKTVYEDSGALLSAVSVAVPFGDQFLLGAIYEDGVLLCRK